MAPVSASAHPSAAPKHTHTAFGLIGGRMTASAEPARQPLARSASIRPRLRPFFGGRRSGRQPQRRVCTTCSGGGDRQDVKGRVRAAWLGRVSESTRRGGRRRRCGGGRSVATWRVWGAFGEVETVDSPLGGRRCLDAERADAGGPRRGTDACHLCCGLACMPWLWTILHSLCRGCPPALIIPRGVSAGGRLGWGALLML